MNLINMFTKKDTTLSDKLKNAALDPGFRPVFYKALLASDIYVFIVSKGNLLNGKLLLKTDKNISVLSWKKSNGELVIPIFSSEKEMHKAAKKRECSHNCVT